MRVSKFLLPVVPSSAPSSAKSSSSTNNIKLCRLLYKFKINNASSVKDYHKALPDISQRIRIRLFIANRTFLVRFSGKSGEFGRAMVCILVRRIVEAKFHGETKRASYAAEAYQQKVRLDICRTQIRLGEHDIRAITGQ